MNRKYKFIAAVCLIAQSFTSFVLSFVYANRKKELSHAFLGLGILGGLGGAYLLYNDYVENKKALAFDGDEWDDGDYEDDFIDEDGADDINFTIADENGEENADEKTAEESAEESADESEEKPE